MLGLRKEIFQYEGEAQCMLCLGMVQRHQSVQTVMRSITDQESYAFSTTLLLEHRATLTMSKQ